MKGLHTDGCGRAIWRGLPIGFMDYQDFKDWALANGYFPGASPDRIDPAQGYTPENIQWITAQANRTKARNAHKATCRCFWCKSKTA